MKYATVAQNETTGPEPKAGANLSLCALERPAIAGRSRVGIPPVAS